MLATLRPGLLLLCLLASHANASVHTWLNTSLPTEERLQSFLSQLSVTQKFHMTQGDQSLETDQCIGYVAGNTTLGVPSVCMGDGPEGVGNDLNNVTAFPAPVLITSSWDTELFYLFGQALAQEHRSKGRNVVLAPTINIVRTPLWGRAAESMSEDPFLNGRMAVAAVQGIQSQQMIACPKHFAAYNQETNRFGLAPGFDAIDSRVDERTLHEIYLPAFKSAVQDGHAGSVMCSYNKLNGIHACENPWLYDQLKTTGDSPALAGLDNSQPGGSLIDLYGFPAFFGEMLIEAVQNGSVPFSRVEDMAARLWRPMFELGVIDRPVEGSETTVARTQAHLDLAQRLVEEGSVLLKNNRETLPLQKQKYHSIAVFGADATSKIQYSEKHGGFVIDSTTVVQSPLEHIKKRASEEDISVTYSEAYPGTDTFTTVPSHMFGNSGLNVTYWKTVDWSGPVNRTVKANNITLEDYPVELGASWPDVFSSRYEGTFYPNTTGLYHFSLYGNGNAVLYLDGKLTANLNGSNFGMVVQGIASLTKNRPVAIRVDYSMGTSVDTGAYGVSLGVNFASPERYPDAIAVAEKADVSVVFVSDQHTEGLDSNLGLQLPGDQNDLISLLATHSKRVVVVLNTNSAILMPWIDKVDSVVEAFYPGQQVGPALARLLFGDVNFSGKLTVTFPQSIENTPTSPPERFPGVDLVANYSEGLYVGYRWYDEFHVKTLFPFGHGLSYTRFEYSNLIVDKRTVNKTDFIIETTFSIRNAGPVAGKEIAQLYITFPEEANEPPKVLKGFQKTAINASETAHLQFTLSKEDLMIWSEETSDWEFVSGAYIINVGSSSQDVWLKRTVILR